MCNLHLIMVGYEISVFLVCNYEIADKILFGLEVPKFSAKFFIITGF